MESLQRLDYRELSAHRPLFLDYIYCYDRLARFFAGNPREPESWRRAAGSLDSHPADRVRLAQILESQNRSLGADDKVLAAIGSLAEGALAVVTGQQVGLFGGPLYTLYKALTAVEVARHASALIDRKVVALFWMDADDHDFEEVRQVRLLDRSHELRTLAYSPGKTAGRVPVGQIRLESAIEELVAEADRCLDPTEFKQDTLLGIRECYAPGRSLAEAFGRYLLQMTRGTGLAIVDPTARELKALAVPLFERETSERSESSLRVQETTASLVSFGYHAQATTATDRLNLFYAAPGRFHVIAEDSGFRIAADGRLLTVGEIQKLIREEPERFSPNVLLRSAYQDTILPTLAYVAGPNELAYFAQLGDAYRHFGLSMPLIVPRASFTIVEKPHLKFMQRYGIELKELRANDESLLNRILKDQTPPELEKDLLRARSCVQEITQTLERDLGSIDPTLAPTVRSTRGKLLHLLGDLEAKSLRAIKRKDETLRRQFYSARSSVFPGFDMQERQLSPLQYLAKYGSYFPEMVRKSIDPESPAHLLLYP